jgi:hypothetical protein
MYCNLIKLQYYKLAQLYTKRTNNNGYNYELFEDWDRTDSTQPLYGGV